MIKIAPSLLAADFRKVGAEIERIRLSVEKMIGKPVALSIVEVRTPDTNAQLVAENIASQLEKRITFRRAMKQVMLRTMRSGALGIKTACSGRRIIHCASCSANWLCRMILT